MGDFVFLSYFRGSGVLGLSSRPAGSQSLGTKSTGRFRNNSLQGNSRVLQLMLETFLAGALYREFCREFMRILTDFPWKTPQKSIIIRVFWPFVANYDGFFCGFFQGKSSEFA